MSAPHDLRPVPLRRAATVRLPPPAATTIPSGRAHVLELWLRAAFHRVEALWGRGSSDQPPSVVFKAERVEPPAPSMSPMSAPAGLYEIRRRTRDVPRESSDAIKSGIAATVSLRPKSRSMSARILAQNIHDTQVALPGFVTSLEVRDEEDRPTDALVATVVERV